MADDWRAEFGEADAVGEVAIDSEWAAGYGVMTVLDARAITRPTRR
jgi:hypothetical protein